MDESDQEDQGEDHVDREHEEDPAIARFRARGFRKSSAATKTESGIATDLAAAFRPAKMPDSSGSMRVVRRGHETAVCAPLPIPARTTTTTVSGSSRMIVPPKAAATRVAQPSA